MSTCVLARQRCTANGTKPPATVHCSPSYCVRYRCGSSATSSSAARLKRRGQQERQARERRERARKKLAATALQPGAGCSSQTPLLRSVKTPIFQAKKAKISSRGSAPHPAGALPQTPSGTLIPVGGYTWCPPRAHTLTYTLPCAKQYHASHDHLIMDTYRGRLRMSCRYGYLRTPRRMGDGAALFLFLCFCPSVAVYAGMWKADRQANLQTSDPPVGRHRAEN